MVWKFATLFLYYESRLMGNWCVAQSFIGLWARGHEATHLTYLVDYMALLELLEHWRLVNDSAWDEVLNLERIRKLKLKSIPLGVLQTNFIGYCKHTFATKFIVFLFHQKIILLWYFFIFLLSPSKGSSIKDVSSFFKMFNHPPSPCLPI